MTPDGVVRLACHDDALAVRDLILGAARAVHRLGAAVAHGEHPEHLWLHHAFPEAAELLATGDRDHVPPLVAHRAHGTSDEAGAVPDVGVGEEEDLASRRTRSVLARPGLSKPLGRQVRVVDDAYPSVRAGHRPRDVAGAVGRSVVDDDDFERGVRRRQRRPHACLDVPPFVARGHDDRDQRRVGRRLGREIAEVA